MRSVLLALLAVLVLAPAARAGTTTSTDSPRDPSLPASQDFPMTDSSLVGAPVTCVTAGITHRRFLDTAGPLAFPGAPPPQPVAPEPGTTGPPPPPPLAVP